MLVTTLMSSREFNKVSHVTAMTVTEIHHSDQLQGQYGFLHDNDAVRFHEPKKPSVVMVVYQGSKKPSRIILPDNSDHIR